MILIFVHFCLPDCQEYARNFVRSESFWRILCRTRGFCLSGPIDLVVFNDFSSLSIVFGTAGRLKTFFSLYLFPLSDVMDLRHQSSAISIIMLEGEDTHPLSATKVAKNLPATFPVTKKQPSNYS